MTVEWWSFFIVELIIAGILISKSVFYSKLCRNTCVTVLKLKIYKITTCAIGYLRRKLLCFEKITTLSYITELNR